jgi:hypothetical protein
MLSGAVQKLADELRELGYRVAGYSLKYDPN